MNVIVRGAIAVVVALTTPLATSVTSHAGGVFPLDRNRLTREWFHSGSAVYNVAGPGFTVTRQS